MRLLALVLVFVLSLPAAPSFGQGADRTVPTTTVSAAMDTVQDVFFHRIALEHILGTPTLLEALAPYGADRAKGKVQLQALLDQEAGRVIEVVDLVAKDLGQGSTVVLCEVVRLLGTRSTPEDLAFLQLARQLRARLKFELSQEGHARGPIAVGLREQDRLLAKFIAERSHGGDRAARQRVATFVKAMPPYQLWNWFSTGGTNATIDQPSASQTPARIDVNSATQEQLERLAGVSSATARKIIEWRDEHGGINALSELEQVQGIGPRTIQKLATGAFAGDFVRPRREWTVLAYSAMANNLESSGLSQMNEMEKVGSGPAMHVVRQLARSRGEASDERNWAGSRRYYVVHDEDPQRITSPVLANLGDIDSGRPEALVDFCRWAIPLFPASRYWLALENHGGGPLWGYGSDDDHRSHQSLAEVGRAVAAATEALRRSTGRPDARFDVISFHACMMGTVEVVHELRRHARVIIASESYGWGGWGWEGYLAELAKNPSMSLDAFARRFADHLRAWVGSMKSWDWREEMNLTVMAVDTDRLDPLFEAVDELGRSLSANLEAVAEAYKDARGVEAQFGDAYDLELFCTALASGCSDPRIKAAARRVSEVIGHPTPEVVPGLVKGLKISVKRPGSIVWSINGWRDEPPQAMRPSGSRMFLQRNLVQTPLAAASRKGVYTLVFPDFDAGKLDVKEVDWRLMGPRGGLGPVNRLDRLHPDVAELVTTTFGSRSPLIVEGHTQGFAGARGLAIELPLPEDPVKYRRFLSKYLETSWARETSWGSLAEQIGPALMPPPWNAPAPSPSPSHE